MGIAPQKYLIKKMREFKLIILTVTTGKRALGISSLIGINQFSPRRKAYLLLISFSKKAFNVLYINSPCLKASPASSGPYTLDGTHSGRSPR